MNSDYFTKPAAYTPPTREQKLRNLQAQKAAANKRIQREMDYIAKLDSDMARLVSEDA